MGEFKRLFKAVAVVKKTLSRIMFTIGVHHVKRLLELVGLTECQERDVLVTVLGTVVCMRVVELYFLQVCDILWDRDALMSCTWAPWQCIFIGESRIQRAGNVCSGGLGGV